MSFLDPTLQNQADASRICDARADDVRSGNSKSPVGQDLAASIKAAMIDEVGGRLKLLQWYHAAALAGDEIPYKGDRPVLSRICQAAGLEKKDYSLGKCDDIVEYWSPFFKRQRYFYRIKLRDKLPYVDKRGVDVPRNILVAAIRAEAEATSVGTCRSLLLHLADVAAQDRTLPNWNGGPNHSQICRDAGLLERSETKVEEAIRDWAGFFHLADALTVNRNGEVIVKRVGRIEVKKYIDQLKDEGRLLYRSAKGRTLISYNAIAVEINLPHSTVTNADCKNLLKAYQEECRQAGKSNDGLGDKWPGLSDAERQARRVRRAELMKYVHECVNAGIPLPARKGLRTGIDFDEVVRRSGKPGPTLWDDVGYKRQIWAAGAIIAPIDARPASGVDYNYILTIIPDEIASGLKPTSATVKRSQARSAILKIRDHVGARDGHQIGVNRPVGDDFGATRSAFERLLDKMDEQEIWGKTRATMRTMARKVREHIEILRRDDGLGENFCAAVAEAVRRDGRSLSQLSTATGISASSIETWMRDAGWPNNNNRELIPNLEDELGLPVGRLSDLLFDGGSLKNGPRQARQLGPGMRIHAAANWMTMPEGEFVAMYQYIETNLLRRNTAHGAAMREAAARRVEGELRHKEIGDALPGVSDRIKEELDELLDHMTKPFGTKLSRRPGVIWQTNTTAPMKIDTLLSFIKWQIQPVQLGGIGRDSHSVTLADLLHPPLVFAYIDHRASRFSEVEWEGKKRGTVFTPSEIDFLKTIASLVDQEFGFVTQKAELAARVEADRRKLPVFAFVDNSGIAISNDSGRDQDRPTNSGVDIMPHELCNLSGPEFLKRLRRAEKSYRQAAADLEPIADSTRDPMEPIAPIIEDEEPLQTVLTQLALAAERAPSRRHEMQFHLHRRDLLINRIFALTTLRSKNVCEINIGGPDPNLIFDENEGKWLLQIHWKQFKNFRSALIFGRKGKREWYRKYLPDSCGLYDLIAAYNDETRPWLTHRNGQRSDVPLTDRWLVTSKGNPLDHSTMWKLVFEFTAQHFAGNPYKGTGIPGCQPFGPHCYRDIRATDILRNPTPGQDPYIEAAIALQTSPKMIHDHYGRIPSDVRNAAADVRYLKVEGRVQQLLSAR